MENNYENGVKEIRENTRFPLQLLVSFYFKIVFHWVTNSVSSIDFKVRLDANTDRRSVEINFRLESLRDQTRWNETANDFDFSEADQTAIRGFQYNKFTLSLRLTHCYYRSNHCNLPVT